MSKLIDNKAIKIPASHYVGFQKRSVDGVPLGFMTIDGTDKASEKRKSTVDAWAKGNTWQAHSKQATLTSKTFENKPLVGFKMGRNISYGSGWDSRHDKWRIEDPRGFELEISSGNLEEIMNLCTLEKGEVLEPCIWGRLGNENILIPTESPVYKTAAVNTERLNTKGTIRDAVPGSHLVFANGEEGYYVGKTFASGYFLSKRQRKESKERYDYEDQIITRDYKAFNDKAIHTYYLVDKDGTPRSIVMRDSLKLSYVNAPDSPKTVADMCDFVNDLIGRSHRYVDMPGKYSKEYVSPTVLQLSPELVDMSKFDNEFFIKEIPSFEELREIVALQNAGGVYYSSYVIVKTPQDIPEYGYGHFYDSDKTKLPSPKDFHSFRRLETKALFDDKEKVRMTKEETYMGRTHSWNYNTPAIPMQRTVADYVDLKSYTIDQLAFVKIMGRYVTFSGKTVERDHTEE